VIHFAYKQISDFVCLGAGESLLPSDPIVRSIAMERHLSDGCRGANNLVPADYWVPERRRDGQIQRIGEFRAGGDV
jgi:hypothetical protein